MPFRRSENIRRDLNWMGHISFLSMLIFVGQKYKYHTYKGGFVRCVHDIQTKMAARLERWTKTEVRCVICCFFFWHAKGNLDKLTRSCASKELRKNVKWCIMLYNNATLHIAQKTQQWLQQYGWEMLQWSYTGSCLCTLRLSSLWAPQTAFTEAADCE
jgi:hypothetical protein